MVGARLTSDGRQINRYLGETELEFELRFARESMGCQTSDVHHEDLHHNFETPRDLCAGEIDPLGKKRHEPGAKLDAGKSPILRGVIQYFPRALEEVSKVSQHGATKYTWKGWESVPDGVNRYGDALARHLLAEQTEGPIDAASGMLHTAQVAWNALARLELILRGTK